MSLSNTFDTIGRILIGLQFLLKILMFCLKRQDISANFNSSGKIVCPTALLNMICKVVETRSGSLFNSFGGVLLKVVDLEGFTSILFSILSTDTFSNE